ncbi:MAG: hypothetical protein JWN44_2615 [Myxococcales bacterium]|nr:hypothetical protein [Myxococcales bacterium]
MSLKHLAYLAPLLLAAGCGDKLTPFNPGNSLDFASDPGDGGGGGMGDMGQMAVIDMAGFNQAGSPVVTIISPAAGAEVQYDTLIIKVTVTSPSSTLISSGSVQITVTPPGGGIVTAPMFLTAVADTYQGQIDIDNVPSGTASFTVSAADIAGLKGSATGSYIHDHGPTLTFAKPTATSVKGTVSVEILVDDPIHPITMLSQVKAGIRTSNDITLTQVMGASPFRVAATVDLTQYNPSLDGPQIITAQATNSKGTIGKALKSFTVDNAGPNIVITQPAAGTFVGGVIEIKADITDPTKVNDGSVVAVFGGSLATSVNLTRLANDTFHGFFDVRSLGKNYVLPELSVRADDTLGNHGETGEEIIVDTTKPWLTMDSNIKLRVGKADPGGALECSSTTSPLGSDAAHEGQVVQQIVTLRARIEDHGNFAPGLAVERFSGIDDPTVTMYAMPDDGTPLAVDTDGDTFCDDVNPTLVPTTDVMMSGEALALSMKSMTVKDGADFRFDATHTPTTRGGTCVVGTDPDCPPVGCSYVGDTSNANPPPRLCVTTNQTYALSYSGSFLPAIWTVPPVSTAECAGFQLDTLNRLPEGPTCVIARATDKAGNTNVSFPLHICIDRGGGLCATFVPTATRCTGVYDKAMQKIVAGTCAMPPQQSAANPHPSPGTFTTLGKEVRYSDTGGSAVP